jgi:hypothetical protein
MRVAALRAADDVTVNCRRGVKAYQSANQRVARHTRHPQYGFVLLLTILLCDINVTIVLAHATDYYVFVTPSRGIGFVYLKHHNTVGL